MGYAGTPGPHQVGSVSTAAITYDASGKRIQKSDPGVEVETYTWAPPEGLLATRAAGAVLLLLAGVRHYHTDALGSTQVVTDETGAVLQQIRYDAWGKVRTRKDAAGVDISPGDDARREFTGYEGEHLSGLQYAGARFYDPELGQFLSHDPANQLPSPYEYGPGDPLNGTDPSGAFWEAVAALALITGIFTSAVSVSRAFNYGGTSAGLKALGIAVASFAVSYGSFLNYAGEVQRSALVELACEEYWKMVGLVDLFFESRGYLPSSSSSLSVFLQNVRSARGEEE